jgi:hypothetical protein
MDVVGASDAFFLSMVYRLTCSKQRNGRVSGRWVVYGESPRLLGGGVRFLAVGVRGQDPSRESGVLGGVVLLSGQDPTERGWCCGGVGWAGSEQGGGSSGGN